MKATAMREMVEMTVVMRVGLGMEVVVVVVVLGVETEWVY